MVLCCFKPAGQQYAAEPDEVAKLASPAPTPAAVSSSAVQQKPKSSTSHAGNASSMATDAQISQTTSEATVAVQHVANNRDHDSMVEDSALVDPNMMNAPSTAWERAKKNFQTCKPDELVSDITHMTYIGSGAYSRVYRGTWHSSVVAVKFVASRTAQLATSASFAEALVSKELSHPNVVQTFATRCTQLTQEYLEQLFSDNSSEHPLSRLGGRPPDMGDFHSGDGFGDPAAHLQRGVYSDTVLRDILKSVGAQSGDFLTAIIMDYSDKGSLQNAVVRGVFNGCGTGPEARVRYRALLRTAREIAQGLDHLHRLGVVHGDLKSANVLLKGSRTDRRGFTAQVIDFGLSLLVEHTSHVSMPNAQGTLVYMAPEVFAGKVGKAADIYALGILMNEMLTGRPPYQDMLQGQIVQGIAQGTLRPYWPPGERPELQALFKRCVAQDPHARPKASDVVEELMKIEVQVRADAQMSAAGGSPSITPRASAQNHM